MSHRQRRRLVWLVLVLAAAVMATGFAYGLPVVQQRFGWRVSELRARIKYALSPPQEAVFTPNPTVAAAVRQTLTASAPTMTLTPKPGPSATATITPTPTPEPTPIPKRVQLTGVRHEYQLWNNCAPANLAMGLSYWGWEGDQKIVAAYTKPNPRDKNVMPYELENFVEEKTPYKVVVRVAGDLALIKRFIAAGFPVMVEKGFEGTDFSGWMGHYHLVTGYDDGEQRFTVQDSYHGGPDMPLPYDDLLNYWRQFNYTYLVIYPPEQEQQVFAILGPHLDKQYNWRAAADKASQEISTSAGRDLFFAWFNRGNSLVGLQDYAGGAAAFDEAFRIYQELDPDLRPWRILWYQTFPYWAYFYTGRYSDVINLANLTLEAMSEPVLEESYYWRALAKQALGDSEGAVADLRMSLEVHPAFPPSLYQLDLMGLAP